MCWSTEAILLLDFGTNNLEWTSFEIAKTTPSLALTPIHKL